MRQLIQAMQQQMAGPGAHPRNGTISGYDPSSYAVKVTIQPEGHETGWIRLSATAVGNGWGIAAGPQIGDEVSVSFDGGDVQLGSVEGRFFNDTNPPPPVPSGEFWIIHQSGSLLKFKNNGDIELVAANNINSAAKNWNHQGNFNLFGDQVTSGKTTSQGQIVGQSGMAVSGGSGSTVDGGFKVSNGDVEADGVSLKNHLTTNVQPGGGLSGKPQ